MGIYDINDIWYMGIYVIYLVGGFNPSEKYQSIGMIIPNIWENKKCSKPPTRYCYMGSPFRGGSSASSKAGAGHAIKEDWPKGPCVVSVTSSKKGLLYLMRIFWSSILNMLYAQQSVLLMQIVCPETEIPFQIPMQKEKDAEIPMLFFFVRLSNEAVSIAGILDRPLRSSLQSK